MINKIAATGASRVEVVHCFDPELVCSGSDNLVFFQSVVLAKISRERRRIHLSKKLTKGFLSHAQSAEALAHCAKTNDCQSVAYLYGVDCALNDDLYAAIKNGFRASGFGEALMPVCGAMVVGYPHEVVEILNNSLNQSKDKKKTTLFDALRLPIEYADDDLALLFERDQDTGRDIEL